MTDNIFSFCRSCIAINETRCHHDRTKHTCGDIGFATLIIASDLIDSEWAIAVDRLVIFCFVFYFWPREDLLIKMDDIGR